MKAKRVALICYILIAAILIPAAAGGLGADLAYDKEGIVQDIYVAPDYIEPYVEGLGNSRLSMEVIYEPTVSLDIVITDHYGRQWHTNPVFAFGEKSTNEERLKRTSSQLVARIVNGTLSDAFEWARDGQETEQTYFSHEESIVKEQIDFDYTYDANGNLVSVIVYYGFGAVRQLVYPMQITETRMEEWCAKLVNEDGTPNESAQRRLRNKYQLFDLEKQREAYERNLSRIEDQKQREAKAKEYAEALDKLVAQYPVLLTDNLYVIYPGSATTPYLRSQLADMWKEVGYTRADLELDHEFAGYVPEIAEMGCVIPVEYKIEGNTFKVSVLTDKIVTTKSTYITQIDLLNCFGAGDDSTTVGYTLVPDGSGAIIEHNTKDIRYTSYTVSLMDRLRDEGLTQEKIRDLPYYEQNILPVFGQVQDDSAWLAIIERGYETAAVNATVADTFSKYNTAYVSFYPIVKEEITYASGFQSFINMYTSVTVKEIEIVKEYDPETKTYIDIENLVKNTYGRFPQTDLVVRYCFLSDEDASYSGMARYYRNYLEKTYGLTRLTPDDPENIPFYADLYGIIRKKVSYVGFPVEVKYALTTFDQASEIVDAFREHGLESIKLRYLYTANGGAKQTIANKFKVEGKLGGSKGFKEFLAEMAEKGVQVYPEIDILHVYKDQMFDGFSPDNDVVMTLGKVKSVVIGKNLATGYIDRDVEKTYYQPHWPLSPKVYSKVFAKLFNAYSKYDNYNIALGSVGSVLTSDFEKDMIIDRTQTSRVIVQELQKYSSEGYNIIVNTGYSYTLPFVSAVMEFPMGSSQLTIETYEVPFAQMVWHGYVEYAGEPLNKEQDFKRTVLKCLEYGATVYGRYMYAEDDVLQNTIYQGIYSAHYANWLEDTAAIYKEVNAILGSRQTQFIQNHERLAPDVYVSTYEDGTQIVVNYNLEDFRDPVTGKTVAALGYLVR